MSVLNLPKRNVSLVNPVIGDEEINAVVDVLRSRQLAQGPVVAAFEREFADAIGVRHAIAVNSGTAAVHCGLKALGVAAQDEVLTTPFTFAATATPAIMQGAAVRFVDVDAESFNANLSAFASAATDRTKAVIAVDLFGLPFDRAGKRDLSARGIAVLEDACQAIGASRDGENAGAGCDAAAFSFYATKNLMMGEGGVLTTDDDAVAASARRFRHHGQGHQYEYLELGYNYRLTDVLAAVGRAQMSRLAALTEARRSNARFYDEHLAGVAGLRTPRVPSNVQHAYHQYTILLDSTQTPNGADRDTVRAALSEAGVATGIYYPKPLHLHPLFGGPHRRGEFPVAERLAQQVLSLPIHPALSEDDLRYVALVLRRAVGYEA